LITGSGVGGLPGWDYLVRWRDDRRIEHARMFPTEGEAAEFDADVKAGRTEPRSERRRGPSPTFEAEAMDWLATKQATKRAATGCPTRPWPAAPAPLSITLSPPAGPCEPGTVPTRPVRPRAPELRTLRTEKRTGLRTRNDPQAGPWHHQRRSTACKHVRRQGLEPRTRGLRVRCSAS
jgi:hypothetical protein